MRLYTVLMECVDQPCQFLQCGAHVFGLQTACAQCMHITDVNVFGVLALGDGESGM